LALALATAAAQTPLNPPAIIAYTDRTLYKPGETVTVFIQALDEELKSVQDISVLVTVTDPGQETILDNAVKTDSNGAARLIIELDQESPEGEYLIEAVDEANVYSPAISYFIVCGKCQAMATQQQETITVTTTITSTMATTRIQTTTLTATSTAAGELVPTRDILLTAAVAVLLAIFATQLLIVRRLAVRQA